MRWAKYIAAGLVLFAVSYCGVLHGIFAPPPHYLPAYFERTLDTGAYLSWLADSRDHWLLPNRHVPYLTQPALLQPMVLVIGKTAEFAGLSPVVIYYALQIALYMAVLWALAFCASAFLPRQAERWAAAGVVICSLPFLLYLFPLGTWFAWARDLGMLGVIDYSYQSADGVFRGGLSNGPNLTLGTMTGLLAFAFLGRFARHGRRADFAGLCACGFANGLLHPFELYVFVTSALVSLGVLRWREGRMRTMLPLGACLLGSTALGMLPYLIQTAKTQWLKDASDANQFTASPAWVLLYFGLPTLVTAYLLLLKFRMREPTDLVLQCWVLSSCALLLVPAIPAGFHLLDGFVYGQAFLLVRRAGHDAQLPRLFAVARRPAIAVASGLVALSLWSLGSMWVRIYLDGNSASPVFLSAIQPADEAEALAWLKNNSPPDALVLAPAALAPGVAGIPLNAYGSHDVLSVRFAEQDANLRRIYAGALSARELEGFLAEYGFRFAIVPSSGKLHDEIPGIKVKECGLLSIYEVPHARIKPYPSAGLLPEKGRNGIRESVFRLVAFVANQLPHSRSN